MWVGPPAPPVRKHAPGRAMLMQDSKQQQAGCWGPETPRPLLTGLRDRWDHGMEEAGTEHAGFCFQTARCQLQLSICLFSFVLPFCFTVFMIHVQIHVLTPPREASLVKGQGLQHPKVSEEPSASPLAYPQETRIHGSLYRVQRAARQIRDAMVRAGPATGKPPAASAATDSS